MAKGPIHVLGRTLARRYWATAPSVWGKLPAQGDFVHHRATAEERQVWMSWVELVWSKCEQQTQEKPSRDTAGEQRWVRIDPVAAKMDLRQVPVAFVLPPGYMPFAPRQYVQGVMVASQDKVGRPCPFVVYQRVSPKWMQKQWLRDPDADGQTLLFWWARLVSQMVQGERSLADWLQRLDALWEMYEPGLPQWLGAPPCEPERAAARSVVGETCAGDPAHHLRGVYHLPWVDWPHRVLRHKQPQAAFWIQDGQGGYVQAGPYLNHLWKAPLP